MLIGERLPAVVAAGGACRGLAIWALADGELARRLARAALERARSWTYRDYFGAVRELIDEALAGRPLAPRAPSAPPEASRHARSAGAAPGGPGA